MVDQGLPYLLTYGKGCYSNLFTTCKPHARFSNDKPGKRRPRAYNNRLFDASFVEGITWIEIPNTGRKKGKAIAKG